MAKTVEIHAPTGAVSADAPSDYVTVINESATPLVIQRKLSADAAGRGTWERAHLVRGFNRIPRALWEYAKTKPAYQKRIADGILHEGGVLSASLKQKILTSAPADPAHAALLASKSAKIRSRGPFEVLTAEQLAELAGSPDVFTQYGM